MTLGEPEKHGPVNRCIYCGAAGVPLTDEHILPAGLGGKNLLLKASCVPCAELINREFEHHVLREMLGPFREKYGIKSSDRKRRRRPRPLQKLVLLKRDGSRVTVLPEKENLPPVLWMPVFFPPGALSGERVQMKKWGTFQFPMEMQKYLLHWDAVAVETPRLNDLKFARWLAKVGHAFGVTMLGDAFEPVLPPIILGQETANVTDYIGGMPAVRSRRQPAFLLGVGEASSASGSVYAVAFVRIFAQFGAPLYVVVLGKLTRPWPLPPSEFDNPADFL